jgi:general secretion pathway protein A
MTHMNSSYLNFFGLCENPFDSNSDPRYLYSTRTMIATLDELAYGIRSCKGLLFLTGEVGSGKTTLLRQLLDWLAENQIPNAFVFNARMDTANLFDFILTEFGVSSAARCSGNSLQSLHSWLRARGRAGGTAVLIIDEAQGLSGQTLEDIRFLLDFEVSGRKPLQIVLAGQPELNLKLWKPELRQLRQRISLRCWTVPLTLAETGDYILHRLHVAGAAGEPIFENEALNAVYFYSLGIPRVINLLCGRAIESSAAQQIMPVPARLIEEAASEFQLDESKVRVISTYSRFASSAGAMEREPLAPATLPQQPKAADPRPLEQPRSFMARASAAPADTALALVENERISPLPEIATPTIRQETMPQIRLVRPIVTLSYPSAAVANNPAPIRASSPESSMRVAAPPRRWMPIPRRHLLSRSPWWWSASRVWSLQKTLSDWRDRIVSCGRATLLACQQITRSVVRWLRSPSRSAHPRRGFVP